MLATDVYKPYSNRTGNHRPSVKDLDNYFFDPQQEPESENVYYEDFVSQGDLVVWLGREKHRKTNVILQFGICAATGRNFLHFRFANHRPARVGIIDFETKTGSLSRRYNAICGALGLTPDERRLLRENLSILVVRRMLRDGEALPKVPGDKAKDGSQEFWEEFRRKFPADIYVFDPMRSMHSKDENDSAIESLLSGLRKLFKDSVVVIAHHLRKQLGGGQVDSLSKDVRLWSESARGSSAIKAHADVIICQERETDQQHNEILHFGAFLKDGADIGPLALEETDAQSFCWKVSTVLPDHLTTSLAALKKAGGRFGNRKEAAGVLRRAQIKESTAYRHIKEFQDLGLLKPGSSGSWHLTELKAAWPREV